MFWDVCLCLSVYQLSYLGNHTVKLRHIFCASVLSGDKLCTSGFVDDVTSSHRGPCDASCIFLSAETTVQHNDKDQQVNIGGLHAHCELCTRGKICYLPMPCSIMIYLFHSTVVAACRVCGCECADILQIDNLWCFTSLVRLQLDNNLIEKIENLSDLVNLTWLGNYSLWSKLSLIGPIPWGHSGPLCHALSLSSLSIS